jgi:cytochrome c-type biogenesis protein CcmH
VIRAALRALAGLSLMFATPSARGQAPTTAAPRAAGDSALEARTSAVAAQLRCPVCQGLSIQDSPSELAQSMRSLVRDQLAEGKTPEQVKAYFVSKYGEWILLSPAPHGFNLLAYAIPALVVLGGGAMIVLAVRRWTAGGEASPT